MANDLAEYRSSMLYRLKDTGVKYANADLDEALRRVLNEYSRAFPNITTYDFTVSTSGRTQSITALTDLIAVLQLIHPYQSSLADPYMYEREDFYIVFSSGSPMFYFTGTKIPQAGEHIYVRYSKAHTIKDLDSATATTVKLDHKPIVITGAVGQCAMIRSHSLNEQWGGKPGEMPNLMQWGNTQYSNFIIELQKIKQEINLPTPKHGWALDEWDDNQEVMA